MKITIFAFIYVAAALTLHAEIMVGASLEWLADTSTSIGVYQVTESRKDSDSDFQLSFRLDDTLKGKPPPSAPSSYWVRYLKGSQKPSVSIGDRFLIFLKSDDKGSPRVAHLINLSTPQSGGMDSIAVNCKFEVLSDQMQILAAVRGRLKSHTSDTPTKWQEFPNSRFDVEVPFGSPAFNVLYGGSTCYLLVPEDLKPEKPSQ